mgnify:FL=1
MKELFTKILMAITFCLVSLPMLMAQIPNNSPVPVDVFIESSSGFNRQFEYSSVVDSDTWGIQPLRQTISGEVAWARDDGMYDGDGDGMPDEDYGGDSLNCSWGTTMDLVGKIAIVRRGA